jgi:hypothetical protein
MKFIKVANVENIDVSYTAIVSLESMAQGSVAPWETLLQQFDIPEGWKVHAHHMTLHMGASEDRSIIGQEVELKIVGIGKDENAMALLVQSPLQSKNDKPHITLATAPGAKPYQSNNIENWEKLDYSMSVPGVVAEVAQGGKIITEEDYEKEKQEQEAQQQAQNAKKKKKEQERQKLQQMGFEGAKAYLQQQFPNLPEQAILGKLRGAGLQP